MRRRERHWEGLLGRGAAPGDPPWPTSKVTSVGAVHNLPSLSSGWALKEPTNPMTFLLATYLGLYSFLYWCCKIIFLKKYHPSEEWRVVEINRTSSPNIHSVEYQVWTQDRDWQERKSHENTEGSGRLMYSPQNAEPSSKALQPWVCLKAWSGQWNTSPSLFHNREHSYLSPSLH